MEVLFETSRSIQPIVKPHQWDPSVEKHWARLMARMLAVCRHSMLLRLQATWALAWVPTRVRRLLTCTPCSFHMWDVMLEIGILACWFAVRYIALELHYRTLSEVNTYVSKSHVTVGEIHIFSYPIIDNIISILTASLSNQLRSEFARISFRLSPSATYSSSWRVFSNPWEHRRLRGRLFFR